MNSLSRRDAFKLIYTDTMLTPPYKECNKDLIRSHIEGYPYEVYYAFIDKFYPYRTRYPEDIPFILDEILKLHLTQGCLLEYNQDEVLTWYENDEGHYVLFITYYHEGVWYSYKKEITDSRDFFTELEVYEPISYDTFQISPLKERSISHAEEKLKNNYLWFDNIPCFNFESGIIISTPLGIYLVSKAFHFRFQGVNAKKFLSFLAYNWEYFFISEISPQRQHVCYYPEELEESEEEFDPTEWDRLF